MHIVGHCSAFSKKEKRELLVKLRPLETGEHGSGEASRWTAGGSSNGSSCAPSSSSRSPTTT